MTPGGSISSATFIVFASTLQAVPRSRELIQSCLPSQAKACGVTVGDWKCFSSSMFGRLMFKSASARLFPQLQLAFNCLNNFSRTVPKIDNQHLFVCCWLFQIGELALEQIGVEEMSAPM